MVVIVHNGKVSNCYKNKRENKIIEKIGKIINIIQVDIK